MWSSVTPPTLWVLLPPGTPLQPQTILTQPQRSWVWGWGLLSQPQLSQRPCSPPGPGPDCVGSVTPTLPPCALRLPRPCGSRLGVPLLFSVGPSPKPSWHQLPSPLAAPHRVPGSRPSRLPLFCFEGPSLTGAGELPQPSFPLPALEILSGLQQQPPPVLPPPTCPPTHPTTYPLTLLHVHPATHPASHPPTQLPAYPPTHTFSHPSIYLHAHPPTNMGALPPFRIP